MKLWTSILLLTVVLLSSCVSNRETGYFKMIDNLSTKREVRQFIKAERAYLDSCRAAQPRSQGVPIINNDITSGYYHKPKIDR